MKTRLNSLLLFTVILFMNYFLASSQNAAPKKAVQEMENETIDDPYLPNAFQNKNTSPAYKYYFSGKTEASSISTVQVNIDSDGLNIIGDAANEPGIAFNPLDPMAIVIGWRQFDNVASNFRQAGWSYSSDGGITWTFPGTIDAGVFRSDPVLDQDFQGNFYYNSLSPFPAFYCKVYESTDGGSSWNSGTDAGGGDKQWMAIDRSGGEGSGNIYAFWSSSSSSCLPGNFTRSTDGNLSYEDCIFVDGDPYFGTMAVSDSGELYIVGVSDVSNNLQVIKSENAKDPAAVVSWNTPVLVDMGGDITGWSSVNPEGLFGQANIDVDRSGGIGNGNVYVLASVAKAGDPDPCDVMFSKSVDGGITWTDPLRINDDVSSSNAQWFGTMSVAPNGRIDVIWLDTRDAAAGSDNSALYYSFSIDQGETWSVNEKLSDSFDPHVGYPNQNKMGDYFDMISDETGAHLAWANTLNGEEDVYYSHIIPDIPATTSTDQFNNSDGITLFPNPANSTCTLYGVAMNSTITVYGATGNIIEAFAADGNSVTINLETKSAGIYFIKMNNEDGIPVVKKLVRN